MIDLKRNLIEEIEKIEDSLVLEQLTALIKVADQKSMAELSPEQLDKIQESQDQIENGQFYTHNEVMETLKND